MRGPVRILTDLVVSQSPRWQEATIQLKPQRRLGYLGSLFYAFRVAMMWHRFDVLISANVRNAACFGLMRRLLPFGAPRIMVLELRLDDPRESRAWKTKRLFQRIAMRGIDRICVSSTFEIAEYSRRLKLPADRFRFVPWHTNVLAPGALPSDGGYVFSAGRTGRDWMTFAKAMEGLAVQGVAVCGSEVAERVEFPGNVQVVPEVPYARYRDLLAAARIVVVPLEPHVYSSGQVAFLEAMALGKPVIATSTVGTEDYLVDGRNGLLVPPGSHEALRQAINRVLTNESLEHSIAVEAVATVKRRHTLNAYIDTVLVLARALVDVDKSVAT